MSLLETILAALFASSANDEALRKQIRHWRAEDSAWDLKELEALVTIQFLALHKAQLEQDLDALSKLTHPSLFKRLSSKINGDRNEVKREGITDISIQFICFREAKRARAGKPSRFTVSVTARGTREIHLGTTVHTVAAGSRQGSNFTRSREFHETWTFERSADRWVVCSVR